MINRNQKAKASFFNVWEGKEKKSNTSDDTTHLLWINDVQLWNGNDARPAAFPCGDVKMTQKLRSNSFVPV